MALTRFMTGLLVLRVKKKMQPYLFLLATTTHTRKIAATATITPMITSQSVGRREIAMTLHSIEADIIKSQIKIGVPFFSMSDQGEH